MAPFVEEFRQEGREQGIQIGLQKGIREGEQLGVQNLTLRQLERRLGRVTVIQKKTISKLPLPKLTKLGEDLLDFRTANDLKLWLRENAAQ